MKRLMIMRHAKSAWETDAPTDHARPLNARGRRDAPRVGVALAALGWRPDLVLSSDAARTRETWCGMSGPLDDPPVRYHAELYLAGFGAVQRVVEAAGAEVETLMVLGHNPTMSTVAGLLSGEPLDLKTANVVLLEADVATWRELVTSPGACRLVEHLSPRDL